MSKTFSNDKKYKLTDKIATKGEDKILPMPGRDQELVFGILEKTIDN